MKNEIDQKNFLSRWSTRKLAEVKSEKAAAPVALNETDQEEGGKVDESVAPPPDLPDVEALNADSDFTAFLADNVPRDISKLAFKKLWRSDPVLANIDGLNDYDGDLSMVGRGSEIFKSAYRVGKGYLTDEEIAQEVKSQKEVATKDSSPDAENAETPDMAVPEDPAGAEAKPVEVVELSADAAVEEKSLPEQQPVRPKLS